MMAPMFSLGRMKLTFATGSRNSSMSPASGMRVGLEMCRVSPLRDTIS